MLYRMPCGRGQSLFLCIYLLVAARVQCFFSYVLNVKSIRTPADQARTSPKEPLSTVTQPLLEATNASEEFMCNDACFRLDLSRRPLRSAR